MFSKILVATDGSSDAVHAAEVAAELAERFGSQVILITVYALPTFVSMNGPAFEMGDEFVQEVQDNVIARTSEPFLKRRLRVDERRIVGYPAAEIVNVAEQERADLIVVGSHGVGGLRRFLLGSVSDRVSHHAHCAVLVVKPEGHQ